MEPTEPGLTSLPGDDAGVLGWAFLTGRRLRASQDEFEGAVVGAAKEGHSAAEIAAHAMWPLEEIEKILQRLEAGFGD